MNSFVQFPAGSPQTSDFVRAQKGQYWVPLTKRKKIGVSITVHNHTVLLCPFHLHCNNITPPRRVVR